MHQHKGKLIKFYITPLDATIDAVALPACSVKENGDRTAKGFPDITPCDFFFWGYVKVAVYVPPLPATLEELKNRIFTAVESVSTDMLVRVWQELDYRLDAGRVTKGSHIEHL